VVVWAVVGNSAGGEADEGRDLKTRGDNLPSGESRPGLLGRSRPPASRWPKGAQIAVANVLKERFGTIQPIPPAGLPEDIARIAVFLASDGSGFVNGQDIVIDGGQTSVTRGWSATLALRAEMSKHNDWSRGHDGFADRARQSPLAPCDLYSSPGTGKCIAATELRKAFQTSPSLRDSLLKFVQAFGVQTTHTAICNAQSRLDVRLARWLLMAHDRLAMIRYRSLTSFYR
jgi:Enoyl-(Acyl carrier protein) reductase